MSKLPTLKLNKEFKRAYYQGKFKANPLITTYMVKQRGSRIRYGITVSKKVGNAVKRNRARRIIRQALHELWREGMLSGTGCDMVLVARKDIVGCKTGQVKAAMKKQIVFLKGQQK